MTTFVKWFLLNATVLTGIFFAEQKGAITLIVTNDVSYISIVIMVLYVCMSGFVGRLCYLADRPKHDRMSIQKSSDIGWFAAEHFFSLGLLGTIIGLCVATSTSLGNDMVLSEMVAGLKKGLNTAFYTTMCGIVFSLPLQIQLMILKSKTG
jgi:hypothetical protein